MKEVFLRSVKKITTRLQNALSFGYRLAISYSFKMPNRNTSSFFIAAIVRCNRLEIFTFSAAFLESLLKNMINLLSSVSIHKIQLNKWQNYRILNGGNLLMICLILRWFLCRFEEFNNILKNMQSESCSSFNIETRGLPANNWQGHHRLHASPLRHQVWSPSGKGYRYIKYYNNVTGKFERSETSYTSLLYMLMMCVFA